MVYIVMASIVMASIVMTYIIMAYVGMADVGMAEIWVVLMDLFRLLLEGGTLLMPYGYAVFGDLIGVPGRGVKSSQVYSIQISKSRVPPSSV